MMVSSLVNVTVRSRGDQTLGARAGARLSLRCAGRSGNPAQRRANRQQHTSRTEIVPGRPDRCSS